MMEDSLRQTQSTPGQTGSAAFDSAHPDDQRVVSSVWHLVPRGIRILADLLSSVSPQVPAGGILEAGGRKGEKEKNNPN